MVVLRIRIVFGAHHKVEELVYAFVLGVLVHTVNVLYGTVGSIRNTHGDPALLVQPQQSFFHDVFHFFVIWLDSDEVQCV